MRVQQREPFLETMARQFQELELQSRREQFAREWGQHAEAFSQQCAARQAELLEVHQGQLADLQARLERRFRTPPPTDSEHLQQLRRMQRTLVKQKKFIEALEVLRAVDALERKEAEQHSKRIKHENTVALKELFAQHALERAMLQREVAEEEAKLRQARQEAEQQLFNMRCSWETKPVGSWAAAGAAKGHAGRPGQQKRGSPKRETSVPSVGYVPAAAYAWDSSVRQRDAYPRKTSPCKSGSPYLQQPAAVACAAYGLDDVYKRHQRAPAEHVKDGKPWHEHTVTSSQHWPAQPAIAADWGLTQYAAGPLASSLAADPWSLAGSGASHRHRHRHRSPASPSPRSQQKHSPNGLQQAWERPSSLADSMYRHLPPRQYTTQHPAKHTRRHGRQRPATAQVSGARSDTTDAERPWEEKASQQQQPGLHPGEVYQDHEQDDTCSEGPIAEPSSRRYRSPTRRPATAGGIPGSRPACWQQSESETGDGLPQRSSVPADRWQPGSSLPSEAGEALMYQSTVADDGYTSDDEVSMYLQECSSEWADLQARKYGGSPAKTTHPLSIPEEHDEVAQTPSAAKLDAQALGRAFKSISSSPEAVKSLLQQLLASINGNTRHLVEQSTDPVSQQARTGDNTAVQPAPQHKAHSQQVATQPRAEVSQHASPPRAAAAHAVHAMHPSTAQPFRPQRSQPSSKARPISASTTAPASGGWASQQAAAVDAETRLMQEHQALLGELQQLAEAAATAQHAAAAAQQAPAATASPTMPASSSPSAQRQALINSASPPSGAAPAHAAQQEQLSNASVEAQASPLAEAEAGSAPANSGRQAEVLDKPLAVEAVSRSSSDPVYSSRQDASPGQPASAEAGLRRLSDPAPNRPPALLAKFSLAALHSSAKHLGPPPIVHTRKRSASFASPLSRQSSSRNSFEAPSPAGTSPGRSEKPAASQPAARGLPEPPARHASLPQASESDAAANGDVDASNAENSEPPKAAVPPLLKATGSDQQQALASIPELTSTDGGGGAPALPTSPKLDQLLAAAGTSPRQFNMFNNPVALHDESAVALIGSPGPHSTPGVSSMQSMTERDRVGSLEHWHSGGSDKNSDLSQAADRAVLAHRISTGSSQPEITFTQHTITPDQVWNADTAVAAIPAAATAAVSAEGSAEPSEAQQGAPPRTSSSVARALFVSVEDSASKSPAGAPPTATLSSATTADDTSLRPGGIAAHLQARPSKTPQNSRAPSFSLSPQQQLFDHCKHGRYDEARALLKEGVLSEAVDEEGTTPLMLVAQGGYGRLVKLFLRKDANINARNLAGNTALHFALANQHKAVAKYLIAQGADDGLRNLTGLTCYEWADRLLTV